MYCGANGNKTNQTTKTPQHQGVYPGYQNKPSTREMSPEHTAVEKELCKNPLKGTVLSCSKAKDPPVAVRSYPPHMQQEVISQKGDAEEGLVN